MRVLLYSLNFKPELVGIGRYSGEMAEWLAENGHEVEVVSSPPYYPGWKVHETFSAWRYTHETLGERLSIRRCPLWVPGKPSGIKRILHLASFAFFSFPRVVAAAMSFKPDLLVTIAPAFSCTPGATIAARLSGANASLHIQDFEVDVAIQMGMLPGVFARIALGLERFLLRRFDSVSTISASMLEKLRGAKGLSESRTLLFPNWADTDALHPLPDRGALRQEYAASGQFLVLYSGNMGEKQGLETVLDAARILQPHSNIRFLLCGEGSALGRLKEKATDLTSVHFQPLRPSSELNLLLNAADLHLLPQRADAADLVMPSKLTGILAAGGAVIATANPETELARVIERAGGVRTPPGDASALAKEIMRLSNDPNSLMAMRIKARDYAVQNLGKEYILRAWLEQQTQRLKLARLPSAPWSNSAAASGTK